jgi:hypothetical protein
VEDCRQFLPVGCISLLITLSVFLTDNSANIFFKLFAAILYLRVKAHTAQDLSGVFFLKAESKVNTKFYLQLLFLL